MGSLLSSLMDPSSMAREQWLLLGIVIFILVGSVYFVYKLFTIFKEVGKSTYKPNIGLSRIDPNRKEEDSPGDSTRSK